MKNLINKAWTDKVEGKSHIDRKTGNVQRNSSMNKSMMSDTSQRSIIGEDEMSPCIPKKHLHGQPESVMRAAEALNKVKSSVTKFVQMVQDPENKMITTIQ